MGGNTPINGNKGVNSSNLAQIKLGAKRAEIKTASQKSIFDKLDTNKDGVINEKDSSVVKGKVKNKEGKLVEKQYVKLKDLPEGRSLVADANGKQWVRAKDGTILKESYAKYDEKSGKVDLKKQQDKTTYKASADKLKALNSLIKSGKSARADFDKQLAQDGWAGDLADGISKLWNNKLGEKMGINTGNTASQVRDYLKEYNKNMNALKKAAQKGDAEFEAEFKKIYGKNFSKEALKEIQDAVTKRIDDYNQSQQTGATAVKTTGKIAAGAAIGVATGGTGLVALGAAAAATAAASVAIEEYDSAHITGQHKDSSGKIVKDKGLFREGTDHGKILKDAAIEGAATFVGGAVGMGAKVAAQGSRMAQIGLNVAGDVATGAAQEYIETGEVSVSGTLVNTGFSALGSAASTGLLKDGFEKIKKSFGKAADGVSKKFSAPKSQMPKSVNNGNHIPADDPDADLNRFLNMGDLVARGTNDEPKQGFWSRLFGGKKSTPAQTPTSVNGGISNADRNAALEKLRASAAKRKAANDPGIVIVNRPKSKVQPRVETQKPTVETPKPHVERQGLRADTPQPRPQTAHPSAETPKPHVERQGLRADTPQPRPQTAHPTVENAQPKVEQSQPKVEQRQPKILADDVSTKPKFSTQDEVYDAMDEVHDKLNSMRKKAQVSNKQKIEHLHTEQSQLETTFNEQSSLVKNNIKQKTDEIDVLSTSVTKERQYLKTLESDAKELEQNAVKYESALHDLEKQHGIYTETNGVHGGVIDELDKYAAERRKRFIGAEMADNVKEKIVPDNPSVYHYDSDIAEIFHSYNITSGQNKANVVEELRAKVQEAKRRAAKAQTRVASQRQTLSSTEEQLRTAYSQRNDMENNLSIISEDYKAQKASLAKEIETQENLMQKAMTELENTSVYQALSSKYKELQTILRKFNT